MADTAMFSTSKLLQDKMFIGWACSCEQAVQREAVKTCPPLNFRLHRWHIPLYSPRGS